MSKKSSSLGEKKKKKKIERKYFRTERGRQADLVGIINSASAQTVWKKNTLKQETEGIFL